MSDLVKRLRAEHADWKVSGVVLEAADRIEALEDRLARMNPVGDLFVRAANDFANAKRDGREEAAEIFYKLTTALEDAYPGDVDRMRSDFGWTKPAP